MSLLRPDEVTPPASPHLKEVRLDIPNRVKSNRDLFSIRRTYYLDDDSGQSEHIADLETLR